MNELITHENYTKVDVSMFGTVMEVSYGFSKAVAGPTADFFPPVMILYACLLLSALCNGLMFRTSYVIDLFLWGLNGFFQSFAWPALAVVFMNWFRDSPYRGALYSILSTSQNFGSATAPLIIAPMVKLFGWKASLWTPLAIGAGFALILFLFLNESPNLTASPKSIATTAKNLIPNAEQQNKPSPDLDAAWKALYYSRDFWMLSFGYAFITFIRISMSDWCVILLRENHGLSQETARDCIVICEFGTFRFVIYH
jgi:OPA family glycerol-3-phosphate transporter-like MFS transporter